MAYLGPWPLGGEQRGAIIKAILQHYYRLGEFELAACLAREAGLDGQAEGGRVFAELHSLLRALREHDTGRLLAWTRENSMAGTVERGKSMEGNVERGKSMGMKAERGKGPSENSMEEKVERGNEAGILLTRLAFKLCSIEFMSKLVESGASAAVAYAQQAFPLYHHHHHHHHRQDYEREMGVLMGSLVYGHRLLQSPYADLHPRYLWEEVEASLIDCYCQLRHLPRRSALQQT